MSVEQTNAFIEYIIVVYSQGTVTTVIGMADVHSAEQALLDHCQKLNAQWGYLYQADGTQIGSYRL